MDQLITTIGIAFVFIALAVAALSIGWLITGKKRLHSGGCGKLPNEKKKEECGTKESCSLCDNNPKEDDDATTTKSDDR